MSSAKQYNLLPYKIIPTQAVSTSVTSAPVNIFNKDNIGIEIVWDGTLAGPFTAQVSNSYNPDTGAGTWTTVVQSVTITAAGSPDNGFMNLAGLGSAFIRLVFTRTSGSGNLTATIVGKGL